MLTTLALVVFAAAIVVFFSQEFIKFFKKIFAIKGANLILPLAIASWAVYYFDYWFLWTIYYYWECMNSLLSLLTYLMPFPQYTSPIAMILLLTGVSVLPVLIWDWVTRKRSFKGYRYPYVTSTVIWVITSILLLLI